MEAATIPTAASYLGGAGVALTPAERASLPASLRLLRSDNKFERCIFWGKVFVSGDKGDYYIAQGFGNQLRPQDALDGATSRSFYSHDGVVWSQLPNGSEGILGEEVARLVDGMNEQFSGNPAVEHQLQVEVPPPEPEPVSEPATPASERASEKSASSPRGSTAGSQAEGDAAAGGEGGEDGEDGEAAGDDDDDAAGEGEENAADGDDDAAESERSEPEEPKSTFRTVVVSEIQRLARLVFNVDNEARIVPRGAYYLTSDHRAVPQPGFFGLSDDSASDRSSYLLLRPPQTLKSKTVLETEGIVHSLDFLDSVLTANTSTSIVQDPSNGAVSVRSLVWPGAFAWHVPETNIFGHAYFGNGAKNRDLGFML